MQLEYLEFEWLIHYRCNYRCPYCFFAGEWEKIEKRNKYFPLEQWLAAWQRITLDCKRARLLLTGGEPFIYPAFLELIKKLSKYFSIGFDTNLSCRKEDLVELVKNSTPENISLGLSFHPLFSQFWPFLEKALFLKEHGFNNLCVQYVTYPPQLEQMEYFRNRFIEKELYFIPLPFRGVYEGKTYPAAHSDREKKIIYNNAKHLTNEHQQRVDKHLNQVASESRICKAGQIYARVDADGTVYRCGQYATKSNNGKIGNLFDDNFKLLAQPLPCEQEICPCEFRWIVE